MLRAAIVAAAVLVSSPAVASQSVAALQGTYHADVQTPGGFKRASLSIDGVGDFTMIQPTAATIGYVYRAIGRFTPLRSSGQFSFTDTGGARGTAVLSGIFLTISTRYPNGSTTTITYRKGEL